MNAPEASQVKRVESFLLACVSRPCFAAIEQGAEDTGTAIFVFTVRSGFVHTRFESLANVVEVFPILLSISVSRERLSVMVDPHIHTHLPTYTHNIP